MWNSDELNSSQIAYFFLTNGKTDETGDETVFLTNGRLKKSLGDKIFISSPTMIVLWQNLFHYL